MIDLMPNLTFFVQLGIFLVTLISLHFLVFRPVLRIIAKRRELTEGYRRMAENLNLETEAMIEEYSDEIRKAREEGLAIKGTLTEGGEKEAREIIQKTRSEIEGSMETTRKEIASESKEAQLALRNYSRTLSREMAEKLIGRKVSA